MSSIKSVPVYLIGSTASVSLLFDREEEYETLQQRLEEEGHRRALRKARAYEYGRHKQKPLDTEDDLLMK